MKSCLAEPPSFDNVKLREKSEGVTSITHASLRQTCQKKGQAVKYLNLQYFKLHPCPNPKPHMHKQCVYYHNSKDYKRYGDFYNDIMCKAILKNKQCQNGQSCHNAHSRVQQLYQYQSYKKKFCSHYPNNVNKCQYGEFCSFAHCQEEIRIQLIHNYAFDDDFYMFHYKTEFCPFNLTEHDKSKCVYAHNLQDYRRNPAYHLYQPVSCPNWNMKDLIFQYNSGCENGVNCNMCHGWKQVHYHPNVYKTAKCNTKNCQKGECPHYHSESERRIIPQQYIDNIFRFIPRNRITKGTFKQSQQQTTDSFSQQNSPKKIKSHTSKYLLSVQSNKQICSNSRTQIITHKKQMSSSQSEKSQYHQYLLDHDVVESGAEEEWSQDEDYQVIGHVQKLILDQ